MSPTGPCLLLLLPLLLLLMRPASTLDFRYHSNLEIGQYLQQVNASHPDIAHLYSIGRSVRGEASPANRKCL